MLSLQHKCILNIFDIINKLTLLLQDEGFISHSMMLSNAQRICRKMCHWMWEFFLICFIIVMFGEAKTVQLDENSSWNWSGEVHFTRTKKRGLAVANRDFSRCQIFQYKGRNIAATLAWRKKINFNLHGDFWNYSFCCCHQDIFFRACMVFRIHE